jgi:hypothetical protein
MRQGGDMADRKPHSSNVGYKAERKVHHWIGGHVVLYDREHGFECDADERWIVMHEPSSVHIAIRTREHAYHDMKLAVVDPESVFGEGSFDQYLEGLTAPE